MKEDIYGVSVLLSDGSIRQQRYKVYAKCHDDIAKDLCKDEYNYIDEFTKIEMASKPYVQLWSKIAALTKVYNMITVIENFQGKAFVMFIPEFVNRVQISNVKNLYSDEKYNNFVYGDRTYENEFVIKFKSNANLEDMIKLLESKLSKGR